jgi:hypothetical protein
MAVEFHTTPIGWKIVKATQILANRKIKVLNIPHAENARSTLLIPATA